MIAMLVAFAGIVSVTSEADAQDQMVWSLSSAEADAGDIVTVGIEVENNLGIGGASFHIGFDANVLEYINDSIAITDRFADDGLVLASTSVNANDGSIQIWLIEGSMSAGSEVTVDGQMLTLQFNILPGTNAGKSDIRLFDEPRDYVADGNAQLITDALVTNDGSVDVIGYDISFIVDGEPFETCTLSKGSVITAPDTVPTRDPTAEYRYEFSGWNGLTEGLTVTGDMTFEAEFEEVPRDRHTISVVPQYDGMAWLVSPDGDRVESLDVVEGTSISVTTDEVTIGNTTYTVGTYQDDPQYSYSLTGIHMAPSTDVVDSDIELSLVLDRELRSYTVTWQNWDGTTILQEQVEYGTVPAYDGETPTKAQDAQYFYEFSGWAPEVVAVTGDATYTAAYEGVLRTYTVTWVNDDGSVLETDEDVPYGTIPEYNGETPTKDPTEAVYYYFDGWSPEVSEVTGDATYTAMYYTGAVPYTVTVEVNDPEMGSVSMTSFEVPYGSGIVADGNTLTFGQTSVTATPSDPTAQYTYVFVGWTYEGDSVEGDLKVTAEFAAVTNQYTIVFVVDPDTPWGSVDFYVVTVDYGSVVAFGDDGIITVTTGNEWIAEVEATPNDATAQYTYGFVGWTPGEDFEVTGDATITAEFSRVVNQYTVDFVVDPDTPWGTLDVYDVTVDYGSVVAFGDDGTITVTTGNEWVIDVEVAPFEATAQYTYGFVGWTPGEDFEVTGDTKVTAEFSMTVNTYDVTWVNYNGLVLSVSEVPYGTVPEYDGPTPARPAGDHSTFAHSGWSPEIVEVTGDAIYTAQYTETMNVYTVSWIVDGSVTEQKLAYGTKIVAPENPVKASDELYVYTFSHWSGFHDGTTVTGDVAYEAMFMRENVSYTVHFALEDCPLDLVIEGCRPPTSQPPSSTVRRPSTSSGSSSTDSCTTSGSTATEMPSSFLRIPSSPLPADTSTRSPAGALPSRRR